MQIAQRVHDEHWMNRALELARRGEAQASPNPMVGAVVVKGSFGQTPSRDRLPGAVPHPNVLGAHPQHPARANPGSAPWRTTAFDQRVWPGGR